MKAILAYFTLPKRVARKIMVYRINRAVERKEAPVTERSEASFVRLQNEWPPFPEYGYDCFSTWDRAVLRCRRLLQLADLRTPGRKVLEVGAGDGMVSSILHSYGHQVSLTDLKDWRDSRAKELEFVEADSCRHLPYPDEYFDLVCSYNTFEHLPDPESAFRQIVRVLRPGGLIHLEFAPIYTGPWGLHAYRTLRMPYPQYLFSRGFIDQQLQHLGIWDLGEKRTELQFTNQWKLSDFRNLWASSLYETINETVWKEESCISIILEFPEAFQGRNLTVEDLITSGLMITLKKQ